jgi:hypothetical protein
MTHLVPGQDACPRTADGTFPTTVWSPWNQDRLAPACPVDPWVGPNAADLRVKRQILDVRRALTAVSFGRLCVSVGKVTLAAGFAGLVVLVEELRSALVHPGRLVVHVGCMFMGSGMPALMPHVLVLGLTHKATLTFTHSG